MPVKKVGPNKYAADNDFDDACIYTGDMTKVHDHHCDTHLQSETECNRDLLWSALNPFVKALDGDLTHKAAHEVVLKVGENLITVGDVRFARFMMDKVNPGWQR